MYYIRYKTKRGGSGLSVITTQTTLQNEVLKLFKNKQQARIEKDNIIIGEVYKQDGRWQWYLDIEA